MTRPIKFRAWYENQMIPFLNLSGVNDSYNDDCISLICQHPEMFKVMQFTGLLDKKGKEIYEGDIMQEKFGGLTIRGKVHYEMSMFLILPKDKKWFPLQEPSDWEVIGNIYEHPELLKENV